MAMAKSDAFLGKIGLLNRRIVLAADNMKISIFYKNPSGR